jgi:hypothetical protein
MVTVDRACEGRTSVRDGLRKSAIYDEFVRELVGESE